tara:strand:+ start:1248 stop:1460 length:213 start_codon:yes stop_codon:yes gene_type:complete
MKNREEYTDVIASIASYMQDHLYDTVSWQTDHLKFDSDEEFNEMHSFVMLEVIKELTRLTRTANDNIINE